ncbi:MAG: hypothetical protein PHQ12_00780 [Chthoniobacteraceae bacterium]|nr:hypothetical protein [Chthoniobacteraceae bacterium]
MMHLNLLHRPSPGPNYPLYRRQQELAHGVGLKVTIFLHYQDLFDPAAVRDALRDREEFGDEIALAFHSPRGPGLSVPNGMIWLLSDAKKREVMQIILSKFREVFGRGPASVGSYHLDASCLRILKELAPEVEAVVGGCFEEGVRVFHGCNHSWYLFNEGMPWNPWYPSKTHALRPAASEEDAGGVVAVPHLLRDMSLAYEGRNDFWASHPPNVIRGMGNDASFCPYDLNLIDQFRMQEEWNGGYSYYNSFVSVPWLTWNHNSEYPPEVAWELYTKFLDYLRSLKAQGQVEDMTLSEYARWHKKNRPIGTSEVYLAKEMLYGSGKHYFWYIDAGRRVLIDPTQGGSIGDLRPYAGRLALSTGPDTPNRENGSYPFLIQSQHRTGNSHHSSDGARTTLLLSHGGEVIDLAKIRTKVAGIERQSGKTIMTLTPAEFAFSDGLKGSVVTRYHFIQDGAIGIERTLAGLSDPTAELTLTEYFKAAYGRTEYPEDLHGIRLGIDGADAREVDYDYSGDRHESSGATCVTAAVPQIKTRVELVAENGRATSGACQVGHLFSPYFTLSLNYSVKNEERIVTWMTLSNLSS